MTNKIEQIITAAVEKKCGDIGCQRNDRLSKAILTALDAAGLAVESKALRQAAEGIEPHLDAIVCYASTMSEHEPNRLVHELRAALATTYEPEPTE